MAVDESLVRSVAARQGAPVLRLYRWDPPAISVGYAQELRCEVDVGCCQRAGLDVVRRPTGGRAVLHWNELTYSVVCPADDPLLGGDVRATGRRVGACLVAGLRRFGVAARLEPAGCRSQPPLRGAGASSPCFASASRWEVTCGGRKLVGSAQRRINGALLQHGSVLVGGEHRRLVDYLPGLTPCQRASCRRRLDARSTELTSCCAQPVDWAWLVESLKEGFARTLPAALEPGTLCAAELAEAERLAGDVYQHPERRRTAVASASRVRAVEDTVATVACV